MNRAVRLAAVALLVSACSGNDEGANAQERAGDSWAEICPGFVDFMASGDTSDEAALYKQKAEEVTAWIEKADTEIRPYLIGLRDAANEAAEAHYVADDPAATGNAFAGWMEANSDVAKACEQEGVSID